MKCSTLVLLFALLPTTALVAQEPAKTAPVKEPGLLFYLSGDHGFHADYAAGKADPNYLKDVKIVPGGVKGSYLECGNDQLLS